MFVCLQRVCVLFVLYCNVVRLVSCCAVLCLCGMIKGNLFVWFVRNGLCDVVWFVFCVCFRVLMIFVLNVFVCFV